MSWRLYFIQKKKKSISSRRGNHQYCQIARKRFTVHPFKKYNSSRFETKLVISFISLGNIMIIENPDKSILVKLIDFGLAA
jgi:hypothetical protein